MSDIAALNSIQISPEQEAAYIAEQMACADEMGVAMQESVFYADYLPMEQAPRDCTWIEMRFRSWSDPLHQPASRHARSAGCGDRPGIWRFADGGCLQYADEREWQWRPVTDRAVIDHLVAADVPQHRG